MSFIFLSLCIDFYYSFLRSPFQGRDAAAANNNMEELGNERDWGACCDIPKKLVKMFKNLIRCG